MHVTTRLLPLACGILLTGFISLIGIPALFAGIDQESNTDGFDPAADTYRINEARRQNAIARQLELKYRMMSAYGFDPFNPPVEQPIGHESGQVGPNTWIYRPVYPDQPGEPEQVEIEAGPELLPAPNVAPPANIGPVAPARKVPRALPRPADAQPKDFIPPQKNPPSKRRGPREF